MNTIEYIKNEIDRLYQSNSEIHLYVKKNNPKMLQERSAATIKGVYRNIFQIERIENGRPCRHTFQYGDVLIGQVVIDEIDYVPMVSILNQK